MSPTSTIEHGDLSGEWYENPHLERRLETIEADGPISWDSLHQSFTYDEEKDSFVFFNDPEEVGKLLRVPLAYFFRTEGEVPLNVREIAELLGDVDPFTARFLTAWETQEVRHSEILGKALDFLDIPRPIVNVESRTDTFERVGWLAKRSEKARDVFMLTYLSRGAMHEKQTAMGYRAFETILTAMGELAFVNAVLKPIQKQEATHLGYYLLAAQTYAERMAPWQRRLAGLITRFGYKPVGANDKKRRVEFGHVERVLVPNEYSEIADNIQSIADKIFGIDSNEEEANPLKKIGKHIMQLIGQNPDSGAYVKKRLSACVELSEKEQSMQIAA